MSQPNIQHIKQSQFQYSQLIIDFANSFDVDKSTWTQIALFLDEIKYFWLARLEILEFELEALTERTTCVLLSGAIYLNVQDNEHFYFSSLGDIHILSDPFLKLEHFARMPEETFDSQEMMTYFQRVLCDTLEILKNFKNHFLILPVSLLAVEDPVRHRKLLDQFFLSFLSSIFDKKYEDQKMFCADYRSYEEIEGKLAPYVQERLVFTTAVTEKLSLRDKIEGYIHSQSSYVKLFAGLPEAEVFFAALYSYISQVLDIFLICSMLRLNPYIRYEITFHYLALVMHAFIDDKALRSMIENAIVFYVFRKTMDGRFEDESRSFKNFAAAASKKRALPQIIDAMRKQDIDIFYSGIQRLAVIIEDIFADVIIQGRANG
jgi:hypothetical protein